MARIRVVTDSACDLTAELTDHRDVTVVPLTIRFGDQEFVDRRDLSPKEFWARCAQSPILPETAAPSPGAFQQAFEAAADEGYDGVLCITLSAGVSATFQAARTAADAVADRIAIRVIDSRSLTIGLGLLVIEATDLAAQGNELDVIADRIESLLPHVVVLGAVDTLEHLEKGGRIGGARALLGSLLSIKPVLAVVDGVVEEESKQRTRSRSLRYLADKVRNGPPIRRLGVASGDAPDLDEFLRLLDGIKTEFPVVVTDLGPVVGTHSGPGTVGACVLPVV